MYSTYKTLCVRAQMVGYHNCQCYTVTEYCIQTHLLSHHGGEVENPGRCAKTSKSECLNISKSSETFIERLVSVP